MEIEESKTRVIIQRRRNLIDPSYKKCTLSLQGKDNQNDEDNSNSKNSFEQQMRYVNTICKPIHYNQEFFLPNDIYIEFNRFDVDHSFQVYKSMCKQFRPLLSVTRMKKSKFLNIDLDQSHKGIDNFDFIIDQLDSMQDKNYHNIAQSLREFKETISILKEFSCIRRNPAMQQKNQHIFQKFIDEDLSAVLEEQDPYGYYTFQVTQCVDDLANSSILKAGVNDNFIKMMGSDIDSYKNLIMRQGWFDFNCYSQRNEQSMEYIDILTTLLKTNFDITKLVVSDRVQLFTFDGIRIQATVRTQLVFCFGENDTTGFQNYKSILGYIYLVKYIIDEKSIHYILHQRSKNNSKLSELVYEEPDQSFQHFQYQCSTQHFQDFQEKHNLANQKSNLPDPQQNDHKTCKFKLL